MEGEFSWLVLVTAFAMVTGLGGILAARLWRIAGPRVEPAPAGDAAERGADDPAGWPSP